MRIDEAGRGLSVAHDDRMSDAEIETKIAELEAVLESGATQISVDGTSTSFDHDSIRKQIQALRSQHSTMKKRRPRASRINLGGF